MTPEASLPAVYRAPMWSRDDAVDREQAVAHALARGVVGVGGAVEPDRATGLSSLDDVVDQVRSRHGDRVADRLERFAVVDDGSFVWTRSDEVGFRVGRLEGPWVLDTSDPAARLDLQHVRRCDWSSTEVPPPDVPAAVLETFSRGGRNFQRVRSASAEEATTRWWERRSREA